MKELIALSSLLACCLISCGQSQDKVVGGGCEDCQMMMEGIPASIGWETKIASTTEPGEPLVITGTIYQPDGKTPASGIILYVYHTDNKGEYTPSPDQKVARRHGHLRGWMKTDATGKYRFETIRPASYPRGRNPQHIHPLVKEPGKTLYWIDEYRFDDDPYLTAEVRGRQENRGGGGILHVTRDSKGTWTGKRDIILGMNVPGYN